MHRRMGSYIIKLLSIAVLAGVVYWGADSSPTHASGVGLDDAVSFPSRPVTIIIPFSPGGIMDIQANVLAQVMSRNTGVEFRIVYHAGGAGAVGMRLAKEAVPDGHTIVITSLGPCSLTPHRADLGYVTTRDFRAVARISTVPIAVAVPTNSPFNTLHDLLQYVQAQPDGSTYGTNGPGLVQHVLFSSLLHSIPGASMQHVPFDGGSAAVIGLLLNETDVSVQAVPEYLPYYKANQIRLLAITGAKRSEYYPETPTFQEMGYKTIMESDWFGILAPRETQDEIVLKLQNMIDEALRDEDVKRTFDLTGIAVNFLEGAKFDKEIEREYAFFGKYLREIE